MKRQDDPSRPVGEAGPLHKYLASIVERWTHGDEDRLTAIPNLLFFRREAPTKPAPCLVEPSIILVVQGKKQMVIGDETYPYQADRFLVTSLNLPANSQTLIATPERPCLGLALKLDLRIIADLISLGGLPPVQEQPADRRMGIGAVSPQLLDAFKHLLDLLDEPNSIPVLAPAFQREIHYRLLMSDQAARLWQIASVGSQSHRIARAIDWLKENLSRSFHVEELATRVQMSTSAFNHHFRQLTAMSPLQYQKWLRLNEARRLMLSEKLDAADAAFRVGYESPSQFSREYSRLFGAPPKRDVDVLRSKPNGVASI